MLYFVIQKFGRFDDLYRGIFETYSIFFKNHKNLIFTF